MENKNPITLICHNNKCNYEWTYKGKQKHYACCPRCRYKVNIKKNKVDYLDQAQDRVQENRQKTTVSNVNSTIESIDL